MLTIGFNPETAHPVLDTHEDRMVPSAYDFFGHLTENPSGRLINEPFRYKTPLERATWLLDPRETHFYLVSNSFHEIDQNVVRLPQWRGPYSVISKEGGVADALWAYYKSGHHSAQMAESSARSGFDIVRTMLTDVPMTGLKNNPFTSVKEAELIQRDDYRVRINGNIHCHVSLNIMKEVIERIQNSSLSHPDRLFATAAAIGTVQSFQYHTLVDKLLEKAIEQCPPNAPEEEIRKKLRQLRHRLYDGALLYVWKFLEADTTDYLVGQKATIALLKPKRNGHTLQE